MRPEEAAKALLASLNLPRWAASVLILGEKTRVELVVWVDAGWHCELPMVNNFEGYPVKVRRRPNIVN